MLGTYGHPVHTEGVDDDPHDGEEPEEHALGACGEGLAEGHAVRERADDDRDGKADESGAVCPHPDRPEQHQHGDQGERRDPSGQDERIGYEFELLDKHTGLPGFRDAES